MNTLVLLQISVLSYVDEHSGNTLWPSWCKHGVDTFLESCTLFDISGKYCGQVRPGTTTRQGHGQWMKSDITSWEKFDIIGWVHETWKSADSRRTTLVAYIGGWMNDWPHGNGVCRFQYGDFFAGSFVWGGMFGPGVFWRADGGECIEGIWKDGGLVEGTVLDADGSLWRVAFRGDEYSSEQEIFWDWHKASERTKVGRVVLGVPPRPSPARGELTAPEWHGVVKLAGRALYRGRVRALSPIDSGFDGSKTFGWLPEQVSTVPPSIYPITHSDKVDARLNWTRSASIPF